IVGTITTRGELSIEETLETDLDNFFPIRIRKLTQREALRLMGMSDIDISLIFEIITAKSAQYKLAGNSIVVNVLEDLFRAIKWGY
ncbi:DNA cytosine methyltransferase, partial [Mycobacterium sp.]|uniref:DNA cytosine methyltransferase n=1 Tax=Mycobacterium sp. TaxID=1785 RepID=UPI003A8941C9